jgi:predicted peptidase
MNQFINLKFFMLLLSIGLFACKRDHLYGDVVENGQISLKSNPIEIGSNIAGYYSGTPRFHSPSYRRFPLLINIPGAGGLGNGGKELDDVLEGVGEFLKLREMPSSFEVGEVSYSFIFLLPQFKTAATNSDIDEFIDFAVHNYDVDTSRIYLVGFSIGGRMCSDYAAYRPSRIAALITMGGCSGDEASRDLVSKCSSIVSSNLPVWSFHNLTDSTWPVNDSKRFISTLLSFQPSVKPNLTIFEIGAGKKNHDCWTQASNPSYREEGKNIYEWLLQFHR